MKVIVLLIAASAVFALSDASPVPQLNGPEDIQNFLFGQPHDDNSHVRLRRAACDLFDFKSKWFTPGDSVCAAHCIALGNRGGSCKGTVCHCRK